MNNGNHDYVLNFEIASDTEKTIEDYDDYKDEDYMGEQKEVTNFNKTPNETTEKKSPARIVCDLTNEVNKTSDSEEEPRRHVFGEKKKRTRSSRGQSKDHTLDEEPAKRRNNGKRARDNFCKMMTEYPELLKTKEEIETKVQNLNHSLNLCLATQITKERNLQNQQDIASNLETEQVEIFQNLYEAEDMAQKMEDELLSMVQNVDTLKVALNEVDLALADCQEIQEQMAADRVLINDNILSFRKQLSAAQKIRDVTIDSISRFDKKSYSISQCYQIAQDIISEKKIDLTQNSDENVAPALSESKSKTTRETTITEPLCHLCQDHPRTHVHFHNYDQEDTKGCGFAICESCINQLELDCCPNCRGNTEPGRRMSYYLRIN